MKIKTVIENRIPQQIPKKQNKLLVVAITLIDLFINTFFPFIMGMYFGLTKNLLFLIMLLFLVVFKVEFVLDKGNLKIKIVRGF